MLDDRSLEVLRTQMVLSLGKCQSLMDGYNNDSTELLRKELKREEGCSELERKSYDDSRTFGSVNATLSGWVDRFLDKYNRSYFLNEGRESDLYYLAINILGGLANAYIDDDHERHFEAAELCIDCFLIHLDHSGLRFFSRNKPDRIARLIESVQLPALTY